MRILKPNREKEYKIEGNQVFYWNGEKWLVKETLKSVKKAEDLLVELNGRKNKWQT